MFKRLLCWINHKWVFKGGHWEIPFKYAITKRECARCGLYQEIEQDHTLVMQLLRREVKP